MNGHCFVAQELRRAEVRFRMDDNAIFNCADPDQLISIADHLDERILQRRANYWAARLTPTQQAELLDSTMDTGALVKLAAPVTTGTRRVPGIKLQDDRGIRLLEVLFYARRPARRLDYPGTA